MVNEKIETPYFEDLVRWEGMVDYLYCDVKGLVTIGIGNLVKTADDAARLPLRYRNSGILAVPSTKAVAHAEVRKLYNPESPPSHKVYLAASSDLYLPEADILALVKLRLDRDFLPGIQKLLPNFNTFPLPARQALVDIAYNCGVGGLGKFSHLLEYCGVRYWDAASRSCSRSTSRPERNEWAQNKFLDAARMEPWRK